MLSSLEDRGPKRRAGRRRGADRGGTLGALLLCAAAASAGCGREAPPPARPNVLLISIDTLRADHLSCYGYERETSPRIDRLAREGVLLEDCSSSSSWTLPAHLTMLTGLAVSAHGVCDDRLFTRAGEDGRALPVELHGAFLPELLRGAGYRTGGFYTWKYLEPVFGFGPGFEVYERLGHTFYSYPPVAREFERLRAANDVEGLKELARAHPALFDADRPSSPETVDRALAWIDEVRRDTPHAPFFCFVHLFDVHDPYRPPPPFDRRFTEPGYDGPIDGRNVSSARSDVTPGMSARDLAQLVALYDGEIAWVDSELGRLFDALAERGLAEDTLIVLTSDHGEEFFEHGAKTHRNALYKESVHVPWILAWPRGLPRAKRIAGAVGLVDLTPTVAGLCGLGPPPGASGRDLSGVLRGQAPNAPAVYASELLRFDEGAVPRRLVGLNASEELAIFSARGREPWTVEHFDLALDPRGKGSGRRLVAPDARLERLAQLLESERARSARAKAQAPRRLAGEGEGLGSSALAELAAMGYAGAAEGAALGPRAESDLDAERLCLDGCVWPDE